MSIERFGSGGRWERSVGYSRTVRAGDLVFIAGCTGVGEDGQAVSDSAYEQMRQACRHVEAALALAGATLADVVQTRIYVTDIRLWDAIGRGHAEVFGAAPPVATMVQVVRLIDPKLLVEIEAVASVS